MNKTIKYILPSVLIIALIYIGYTQVLSNKSQKTLYVLAAASLTDVMTEIGELYHTEHPNVEIVFSFDSSGTLSTQIQEGAPADVFLSASLKHMNTLKDASLMKDDSILSLLENKVVLIKPTESSLELQAFEDVLNEDVGMIAIGASHVPVGEYTQALYENLGLWDQVSAKANWATHVRQVLDWVATSNVDCGVVYKTDAAIEPKVEVICEATKDMSKPIIYPAGIVRTSQSQEEAHSFLDFLSSADSKALFEKYGFTMFTP